HCHLVGERPSGEIEGERAVEVVVLASGLQVTRATDERAAVTEQSDMTELALVAVVVDTAPGRVPGGAIAECVEQRQVGGDTFFLAIVAGLAVVGRDRRNEADVAVRRDEALVEARVGVAVLGTGTQGGAVAHVPGQRRSNVFALVVGVVAERVAVTEFADDAIEESTVIVDASG